MTERDLSQLIEEVKAGDHQAFELLMQRYLRSTYFFLFQLVRDGALAEDLTQETFLKVWRHITRFDQSKKFTTWLFTIAKRTAFDALRKKREILFADFAAEENNATLETVEDTQELPDVVIDQELTATELWNKIETLPSVYQVILTLHYQEELSLSEIATLLEISYNTIKSRHTRAIHLLRQAYQNRAASESPQVT